MAAPTVYSAIHAVSGAFVAAGIPKTHTNLADDYDYRSIDDLFNRLSPLLAKHRLCVLPRVLDREVKERMGVGDTLLLNVCVRVAFSIVSVDDGSSHIVECFGEALDPGDKATAKALSAAYKQAMLQAFCVPVTGTEDADAEGHRLSRREVLAEPFQGWEQWVHDIEDIVSVCETEQAIDRVQQNNRRLLAGLQRERAVLYDQLGQAFSARRQFVAKPSRSGASRKTKTNRRRGRQVREEPAAR